VDGMPKAQKFIQQFTMWILNIDDDLDDRETFCDALYEIDPRIECIAKNSAEEAIHLLDEAMKLPDYIFLDINMPKMGGIECLKTIKRNQRLASIPVIVLSTTQDHREIAEVKKLGADFLSKEPVYRRFVASIKRKISANFV
jgi:CheY-like chemotaxis protein